VAIRINDDSMTLEIDDCLMITGSASTPQPTLTAHGSFLLTRSFSRNQAITALPLAERLAVGYGDNDPFVKS
jgi:hypothetical protein